MSENETTQRLLVQQLARLVEVSVTLNTTRDTGELLSFIIQTASEVLDCEAASILLYDERKKRLFFAAASNADPAQLAQIPVPLESSLAGSIFRENRSLIINDVAQDTRHNTSVAQQVNFDTRSLLGVPMRIKDKGVGVLEALNKRNGNFTDTDEKLLSVLASQAAVAIHNARLLAALEQANKDLLETDRLKNNFLALASHELRTPLGIIIGYASFLQEHEQGDVSENAVRVLQAATQMRGLIEAMTSLHSLQGGAMSLKPRVLPIQQAVHAAYEEVREDAQRKQISVNLNLPPQSLLVTADAEKLLPALVNVLNNAIKFTPEGGRIEVSTQSHGGNVLVAVVDNGIGLAPEDLTKIFQEFYQVEPHMTRKHGGLGIGLTVARGLIEVQGGRIWAESAGLGQGSVFKIVLPPAGTSSLAQPT